MFNHGDLLENHFRILEICSGGMGEVYICELLDSSLSRQIEENKKYPRLALKTFKRQYFFNNSTRLSFEREATTWLKLHGIPYIMPVFGIEHFDNRPFILMPAVMPGPNGERSIADVIRYKALEVRKALEYAFQIATALQHAAVRIPDLAHGDLKPANILLMGGNAFVADFGLASANILGKPDLSLESTWAYRSPELWENESRSPSVGSDIYAFGALLFEMITGHLPIIVNSDHREDWANAHLKLSPQIPAEFQMVGLAAATMNLALICLEKNLLSRPVNFAEVLNKISEIYEEHDPLTHLMFQVQTFQLAQSFNQIHDKTRDERIRSLLTIEQTSQALSELDSIPFDEYTPLLWMRRGTTLSLSNRDLEALDCFKRALDGELTFADRINCQCEYGLSLKRLEQFDEAQELFAQLIPTVPEKQMPNVVINLATVYLEQKMGYEAMRLLEPFVRKYPDIPSAWANLGQAYVFEKRFQDAEKAYGKALILAPEQGQTRVLLATVYMDHLGQFERAWTLLDAAYDLGYQSREWLTRILACSILLEDEYTISCIDHGIKDIFPEDQIDEVYDAAGRMAEDLARQYSNDSDVKVIGDEQVESLNSSVNVQDNISTEDSLSADNSSSSIIDEKEKSPPRLPFLNIRNYGFHDFTIDFYQSPTLPNFLESFLTEWRRMTRDPRMSVGGELRGSPFYFTQCPSCSVYVLTNRTLGYKINCRMCETSWQTETIEDQSFNEIIEKVSKTLGIISTQKQVYALLVCTPSDFDLEVVQKICESAGMVYAQKDQLIAMELLKNAIQRGFTTYNTPLSVWILHSTDEVLWSQDATPASISKIVRELQSHIPSIKTISLTIPPDKISYLNKSIDDLMVEKERDLNDVIRKGESTASDYHMLAMIFANQGRMYNAEQMARAAVATDEEMAAAWENLGIILFKQNHFGDARDCLERALFLDPTDIIAMNFLAACYDKLGEKARAAELFTRANSLTGNEFPFSF